MFLLPGNLPGKGDNVKINLLTANERGIKMDFVICFIRYIDHRLTPFAGLAPRFLAKRNVKWSC
jgi:hypothetical protein